MSDQNLSLSSVSRTCFSGLSLLGFRLLQSVQGPIGIFCSNSNQSLVNLSPPPPSADDFIALAFVSIQRHSIERVPQVTLFNLCTHPFYRGRGLGRAMCQECADFARRQNCRLLVGHVEMGRGETTAKLLTLYRRMGAEGTELGSEGCNRLDMDFGKNGQGTETCKKLKVDLTRSAC